MSKVRTLSVAVHCPLQLGGGGSAAVGNVELHNGRQAEAKLGDGMGQEQIKNMEVLRTKDLTGCTDKEANVCKH